MYTNGKLRLSGQEGQPAFYFLVEVTQFQLKDKKMILAIKIMFETLATNPESKNTRKGAFPHLLSSYSIKVLYAT